MSGVSREQLISEKLANFKKYLEEKCTNKDNEYYQKLSNADVDYIVTFATENIGQYKILGMDTIVNSFLTYLELELSDEELRKKITKYFDFFAEILNLS